MSNKQGEITTDTGSAQPIVETNLASSQPSESGQQAEPASARQSKSELTASICQIFTDHLIIEVPDVEVDLIEIGLLDSLTMVDLLVHLERQFGFTIVMDDLDVDDFRSVSSIADYVARSLG